MCALFVMYCMLLCGEWCCFVSACVVCSNVFVCVVHNCMMLYGLWFVRRCVVVGCCYLFVWFVCDPLCDVVCFLTKCVCVLCVMYCVMLSGVVVFVFV